MPLPIEQNKPNHLRPGDDLAILMASRRYCFVLSAKQPDGHYYVGVAVENERGYFLTNWDYGTDHAKAEIAVDILNERRGIDTKTILEVTTSSMRAQNEATA